MLDKQDAINQHAYSYAFVNKTITLIEEPLFTVDNCETMKLIMGGEYMLMNPKNQTPFICKPNGPVIITCNSIPWKNYPPIPYLNRCVIFYMNEPCTFSGEITKELLWTVYFREDKSERD